MNQRQVRIIVSTLFLFTFLTACSGELAPSSILPSPSQTATTAPTATKPATLAPTAAPPTAVPTTPITPTVGMVVSTAAPTAASSPAAKGALVCPPPATVAPNAQLAARVNGQGISLDYYNRQVAQAQTALVSQGLDAKTSAGQEALKSLKQQVLDQMVNDVVIAQQADKEGIKVTDNDLNARLAQMIQDAGGVTKLNEYLAKNQMSLGDLCQQVRNQLLGEAMLNRVTGALPTNVEQVHARQILVSTPQLAQEILKQLRSGKDFATLAKQYSLDEASKANGGDLGWFPKGVMDPQIEAIAFQLKVGQISDVVQTQFGYHIIKVEEHSNSRPLPPELIQNSRQQAFLAWLQAVRGITKIERLVQP